MSERYDLGEVDAFTIGTVGRPGQRTFYIQARNGGQAVTVKCEKQQVAALGQYLRGVLDDLPAATDEPLGASLSMVEPIVAAFVLGPVAVGVDTDRDRIVLQLEEVSDTDEDDPDDEADVTNLRVELTRGQVQAFCRLAEETVAAGRPPCRWCGRPLDPDGHACPRMN
jgi:uncharacterized repeat protein (TIGR03847 family)